MFSTYHRVAIGVYLFLEKRTIAMLPRSDHCVIGGFPSEKFLLQITIKIEHLYQ
mgnify:CR=1